VLPQLIEPLQPFQHQVLFQTESIRQANSSTPAFLSFSIIAAQVLLVRSGTGLVVAFKAPFSTAFSAHPSDPALNPALRKLLY